MKRKIAGSIQKSLKRLGLKWDLEKIENLIEVPSDHEMGDYAFPCFLVSKELRENPHQISMQVRKNMKKIPRGIVDAETVGPYINFFLDRKENVYLFLRKVLKEREKFGRSNIGKRKRVVIEFSSPNIAKSFGIGHIRSTIIGNSIANMYKFNNYTVKKLNYLGDWGAQFGQLIYGYKKFGKDKKMEEDPIKHLQEIYVKVNKSKKMIKESREEFTKLSEGDRENVALWRWFKEVSLDEFQKMYKLLKIKFDEFSSESDAEELAGKVNEELKEKKLTRKSEGAMVVYLKKYGLENAIVKKSDGTTIYTTRDLAEAIRRHKKYKFHEMIYETGEEQSLHFKQVFKILELMGYKWAQSCKHISHGLYLGKDGKKFSTRKGKTADLKEIIEETREFAKKEIKNRFPQISKAELEERTLTIALASLTYGDLKSNRTRNIIFDTKSFVSFEGNTGPYIMYSYARASSIIRKSENEEKFKMPKDITTKEIELYKKLEEFSSVNLTALETLNPSLIANYVYSLCKIFNEFYHSHKVIGEEEETFRLSLIESFRQILRNSCKLLGIELLEQM